MSAWNNSSVHVVEPCISERAALARMLQAAGYAVRCHTKISEFLAVRSQCRVDCVLVDLDSLDVDMDGSVKTVLHFTPLVRTVCMSGNSQIAFAVDVMKAGAADFLVKPLQVAQVLKAVRTIVRPPVVLSSQASREILGSLNDREKFVLRELQAGRRNKQIAHEIGVCERTVKNCRAVLMRKIGARSFAELLLRTVVLEAA